MKRLSLAILLTFCMMGMAAQEGIQVLYEGPQPNIYDFAWAYCLQDNGDAEECERESLTGLADALERYAQGEEQSKNVKLTVDKKNGFLCHEWRDGENMQRIEMCYWNEADKKHKLVAVSRWCYENGKPALGQYDGLSFLRYSNATKKMTFCAAPGFDVEYDNTTYSLPKVGKDITMNKWSKSGQKTQTPLKWNGKGFSK